MDHYIDIRVLPDPELQPAVLMNALFSKLHGCLVRLSCNDIAVSFPESPSQGHGLGALLRLHGSEAGLKHVQAEAWMRGMRDHVRVGKVQPVPATVEYRQVRRVQSKSNPERIRRRQMKRHGWTEAEARQRIPDSAARTLRLPFVQLDSGSTEKRFKLFLDQREAPGPHAGTFNAYGLSTEATVPWF